MNTIVCRMDQPEDAARGYAQADRLFREGQLVAFPTETVYGLGGWIGCDQALKEIYVAKGRPSDNPLIVHISPSFDLSQIAVEISDEAKALMKRFWPGPMTLILKRSKAVSDRVTAGLDTVAVRMPSHPVAMKMLEECGLAIAAPSANRSGRPSTTTAEHVYEDLAGRIPLILDGGACAIGLESTIIDTTVKPAMILRPGGVTLEMIREVIPDICVDPGLGVKATVVPKAPGMKYRHYAPKAPMYMAVGSPDEQVLQIRQALFRARVPEDGDAARRIGVLTVEEHKELFGTDAYAPDVVLTLGQGRDAEEMAASLFDRLREFDEQGCDLLFTESMDQSGIGLAFMNRLGKACGGKTISDYHQ